VRVSILASSNHKAPPRQRGFQAEIALTVSWEARKVRRSWRVFCRNAGKPKGPHGFLMKLRRKHESRECHFDKDLVISMMHCVSWDRENGELVPGVVAKD